MWPILTAIIVICLLPFHTSAVVAQETIFVQIDIDPGSDTNTMTIGKTSIISVAIISTKEFEVSKRIEDEGLKLAGVLVEKGGWGSGDHPKCTDSDVNGDGMFDVVCKFDFRKLKLLPGRHTIELTGTTISSDIAFSGRDNIVVVGE